MYMFAPETCKLIRKIGEGAYGDVHLIETSSPHYKKVAAKKMSIERCTKKIVEEYAIHRALYRKGHENIIGIFEKQTDADFHIFFMGFADGGDIFDRIGNGMDAKKAQKFFSQLLNGLRFIHDNDVVHKDIKPENLLIHGQNTLKITDFGNATFYRKKGKEILLRTTGGTRHYSAPEVFSGQEYRGPPCDIWSAGVTLVAMLTGDQPWDRADVFNDGYINWIEGKRLYKQPWSKIDSQTIALLRKIVTENADARLTIDEIDQDPYWEMYGLNWQNDENKEDIPQ